MITHPIPYPFLPAPCVHSQFTRIILRFGLVRWPRLYLINESLLIDVGRFMTHVEDSNLYVGVTRDSDWLKLAHVHRHTFIARPGAMRTQVFAGQPTINP